MNCCFSHDDVTKIHTTKLSILLRFYFHDILEQLKNNFHTNFRFKILLGFVGFCGTWHLHDGGESRRLKKWLVSGNFAIQTFQELKKVLLWYLWVPWGINSCFFSKTRQQMFLLVSVHHVGAHLDGHLNGISIQIAINLGKTFLQISHITQILWPESWRGSLHIYLLSFPRFLNLSIERFCFDFDLFWMAWHWKPATQQMLCMLFSSNIPWRL